MRKLLREYTNTEPLERLWEASMRFISTALLLVLGCWIVQPAMADDGSRLLSVDHYVRVHSTVPAIKGETTAIYLREVVLAGTALRDAAAPGRVVLFVHGAGTPAE